MEILSTITGILVSVAGFIITICIFVSLVSVVIISFGKLEEIRIKNKKKLDEFFKDQADSAQKAAKNGRIF